MSASNNLFQRCTEETTLLFVRVDLSSMNMCSPSCNWIWPNLPREFAASRTFSRSRTATSILPSGRSNSEWTRREQHLRKRLGFRVPQTDVFVIGKTEGNSLSNKANNSD